MFFFSPHIGFHLSIHLSVHIFCSFCHIFCKQQTPAPASLQLLENPKARKLFALLTVMAAAAASTLLLLLPQQPELLFTSLSLAYVLCHVGIVDLLIRQSRYILCLGQAQTRFEVFNVMINVIGDSMWFPSCVISINRLRSFYAPLGEEFSQRGEQKQC